MKVIDNICKNCTLGSKKYAVVAVKKDVTYVLISHDLLKTQKTRKQHLRVTVELYDYATELYNELSRIGIIEQLSNVPQLGAIRVEHKLEKSRYDYVILQLYLHQLVQENLGKNLKFTYGSGIRLHEFGADESKLEGIGAISVADIVQVLTLAYNIGHFYNTFVSSRAVIMMANANETFRQLLYNGSTDERFSQVLETYLADKNYLRFHLLNSLLVLDKCNPDLYSVKLAREILYAYINEDALEQNNKLKYAFSIFRSIRSVAYIAYDLQVAKVSFTIDFNDEKAMILLLGELLSQYNDRRSSTQLIQSISKLLDDAVYNENSNVLCHCGIAKRMVNVLKRDCDFENEDYYADYFLNGNSPLNEKQSLKTDYDKKQILKLTFDKKDGAIAERLFSDLESLQNVRVGYYDRSNGDKTIVLAVKKSITAEKKQKAAFKVLKATVAALRKVGSIKDYDKRYLLSTKFFLYYLFDENPVNIKPTMNEERCVLCTKGKSKRIKNLKNLLETSHAGEDAKHEVEFMESQLVQDYRNDTSICVPASIEVSKKEEPGKQLCEFDGIVIHPMRKSEQVVFLEAKNTADRPGYGKKCLRRKLSKLKVSYKEEEIIVVDHDAVMKYSV